MATQYMLVKDLPAPVQRVLTEVGYKRRDISVSSAAHYSVSDSGGLGEKAFTAAVDLDSGHYKILWGSWGGANMFNPRNQVDLDDKSYPMPPNGVVVKGHIGGGKPVYASILANPENLTKLLPAKNELALSKDEEKVLDALGYKSSYRQEAFRREGIGDYSPSNPLVKSLAEKGLLKITASGMMITLAGKNYRSQNRVAHMTTALEQAWGMVRQAASEADFWKLVSDIGWGTKTLDIPKTKAELMVKYDSAEIQDLSEIGWKLYDKLQEAILRWVRANGGKFPLGNDSLSDLCWHIIGLGRAEYTTNLKDPARAVERANQGNFTESFIYVFPHPQDYREPLDDNRREALRSQAIQMAAAGIWKALAANSPVGNRIPTGPGFVSVVHTVQIKLGKHIDEIIDALWHEDNLRKAPIQPRLSSDLEAAWGHTHTEKD